MQKSKIAEDLVKLRQALHKNPEVSGEERGTAEKICSFLKQFEPDNIVSGIGGNGIIAEFKGEQSGPTVAFRCELDALPISEKNNISYQSTNAGKAHVCGHDGHMVMIAGLAYSLQKKRPAKGRVLLLFQPAEEDGSGAASMISDDAFKKFEPDFIFALHNLPGIPLHKVILSKSQFASASRGMLIRLKGKSSHAAEPENGINPANGMAKILLMVQDILQEKKLFNDLVLVTPVHARLGELAYGTSPGDGIIHFTLRSYRDDDMKVLMEKLENEVKIISEKEKLSFEIAYEEVFPATVNNQTCSELIKQACVNNSLDFSYIEKPFKWSEDFGHFTAKYRGAIFGLGSGISQPALHNPDFDFPDALIPTGIDLYNSIYNFILEK
ncbi:MAG TPA: amidohydrolase [Bacteroidales bacterium]